MQKCHICVDIMIILSTNRKMVIKFFFQCLALQKSILPTLYDCDIESAHNISTFFDQKIQTIRDNLQVSKDNPVPNIPSGEASCEAECDRTINKLIARGIPILIVRISGYWHRQQTFCVKWGLVTSPRFTVTNGVRQGGILSPYLFIMYVDNLSDIFNSSNIGL